MVAKWSRFLLYVLLNASYYAHSDLIFVGKVAAELENLFIYEKRSLETKYLSGAYNTQRRRRRKRTKRTKWC